MAENKTINIKINSNTKEATKDQQDYNKAIGSTKKQYDAVLKSGDSYEKQLSDINKIVKETPLNVRDMNKQIQAYQSIALSAGRETPVGKEALQKAAQLRDRYIDIQNETKRLADDQRNLEGAMQGMSTGIAVYGGIQSAMALSGVESEKFRETLVKLTAAQTLMNSVNQVATALEKESALMLTLKSAKTKALTLATGAYSAVVGTTSGALKLFRIALISTGIGAIIVGIGLLIANFDKVKNALGGVTDKFKSAGAGVKLLMVPLIPLIAAIELAKKGLEALGIIESEEEKAAKERAREKKKRAEIEKKNLVELQKIRDENFNKRQNQYDLEIRALRIAGKETIEIEKAKILASIEYQKQKAKELGLILKTTEGIQDIEFKGTGKLSNIARQYQKGRRKQAQELEEINVSIANSELDLKELIINYNKEKADSYKEVQDAQQKALDAEIDAEIQLLAEFDKIKQENEARLNTEEQNELLAVANKYDVLESMAYDNAEALKEIEIARLNAENDIKLKYANEAYEAQKAIDDKAAADEKALNEKTKKDALDTQQTKVKFANDALGAISDLTNAFAGESEEAQKRAFKINKAIGITQAIINTAGAISAAINPAVGGLGIPAGLPGAVLAAATGAAQIATIAKTQFEGGGGDSVDAPPSSIEATPPQFNVVGDSGVNQLAALQQTPVQAFVVSGDVTTSQALDRNRVENATL